MRQAEAQGQPRATGLGRPSTSDAGVQAELRAGMWRPNISLARAAQLIAGRMLIDPYSPPETIGREVDGLLAVPATDFVNRDLILATAVGMSYLQRDSAVLQLSQIWELVPTDGTCVRALRHMAAEFAR